MGDGSAWVMRSGYLMGALSRAAITCAGPESTRDRAAPGSPPFFYDAGRAV